MNEYKGHEYEKDGYKKVDPTMVGPGGAVGFNLILGSLGQDRARETYLCVR